jgi:hydroxymethylglutaryl-CoA lyase
VIRTPTRLPTDGLPAEVSVYEVGPRDGLQNEATIVPVETKADFIRQLLAAGLTTVETTSFVHPRWVPQLADAEQLLELLDLPHGVDAPVLVPNQRGLERALACGVRHVAVFGSATDTFARRNLNRTWEEQFVMFEPVVRAATAANVKVRGYVSMCFGDPWEGDVDVHRVVETGRRLLEMGISQLSLGDTIGVATPGQVRVVLAAFERAGLSAAHLAVHFHDTYGQALSNTFVALQAGVTTVDASAGGLGGCPFADSATGNLATEDLVWQLDGLGIQTGVNLERLVETSVWMAEQLGRPSPSRVVQALS